MDATETKKSTLELGDIESKEHKQEPVSQEKTATPDQNSVTTEVEIETKQHKTEALLPQQNDNEQNDNEPPAYVWDGNPTLEVTETTLEGETLLQILSADKHTTVTCEALLQDFGRDGAQKLAIAIENNHSVTSLEIDSCDFGDGGLFYLTEAIAARPDLTSLTLRGLLRK